MGFLSKLFGRSDKPGSDADKAVKDSLEVKVRAKITEETSQSIRSELQRHHHANEFDKLLTYWSVRRGK